MSARAWIIRAVALLSAIGGSLWLASCDVTRDAHPSPIAFVTPTTSGHTPASPPPAPPTSAQSTCAPQLRTAEDYRSVFRQVGPLWTGGDGGGTVDLQDGRRLWLFGDTFSGPVDATSILPGWDMVNNSIAVEQDNCVTFK